MRSKPYPDAVVVGSHLEAAVFAFGRLLILRRRPAIFLLGFIYTGRKSKLLEKLRRAYFRWLFSIIEGVICHSLLEITRYEKLFGAVQGKFIYVPYGLHIHGYEKFAVDQLALTNNQPYTFSAGRSGRDYKTLFKVFNESKRNLHVICDSEAALSECEATDNITVLRNCYDACYVNELKNALIVVVPLSVDDISAGQMVLLQAMAYSKPLIVTRTSTIEEYLEDGVNAILVPPGDAVALDRAIESLYLNPSLAEQLAKSAFDTYQQKHSMKVFVNSIVTEVEARLPLLTD